MIAPAMNLTCYRPLANNGCKSASNSGGVEGIAAFATFYLFWTDKLHVTGVSEVCIGAGDVGGTEEGTEGMEDVAAIFLCLIWNERSHKPLDGPKVCICAGGDARGTEDMATSAAFCAFLVPTLNGELDVPGALNVFVQVVTPGGQRAWPPWSLSSSGQAHVNQKTATRP
eukprot:1161116-Pelagomonas_calceolata.AAC.3